MGVRKIPIGTRSLTAHFYSFKNKRLIDCESLVERDVYLSFEFDDEIASYEAQPVKVPRADNKKTGYYYPDCLITYTVSSGKRPLLSEVKPTKDMNDPKKAEDIALKLAAIEKYAKDKGWDFRLYLETDVRGPRLDNFKLLYQYTEAPAVFLKYGKAIVDEIKLAGPLSVTELLGRITSDKKEYITALPCVWHLIRNSRIKTDLSIPLTNSAILEAS